MHTIRVDTAHESHQHHHRTISNFDDSREIQSIRPSDTSTERRAPHANWMRDGMKDHICV